MSETTQSEYEQLNQRLGQLEYQVSLFAAIMAQTLGGRWTGDDTGGELPTASAELVALLGGEKEAEAIGFSPVPFQAT